MGRGAEELEEVKGGGGGCGVDPLLHILLLHPTGVVGGRGFEVVEGGLEGWGIGAGLQSGWWCLVELRTRECRSS